MWRVAKTRLQWNLPTMIFALFFLALMFGLGCCCTPSCTFVGPLDFSSGAVTDNFSVVSGSWSIGSGVLSTTSSNAILTGLVDNPTDANTKIELTAKATGDGDAIRIILDYADANNYWFVEVVVGFTSPILRIIQRSSGSNTTKATGAIVIATNANFDVCISISRGVLVAQVVNNGSASFSGTFSNATWGIGTGSLSGTASFDDITVSHANDDCVSCKGLCTHCQSGIASPTLKIVVGGIANGSCGDCSTWNGTHYRNYSSNCRYGDDTTEGAAICSGIGAVVGAFLDLGAHQLDGQVTVGGDTAGFEKIYPGLIPCTTLSNESVPRLSGATGNCDLSAATFDATCLN
jgi:hypothetical protein